MKFGNKIIGILILIQLILSSLIFIEKVNALGTKGQHGERRTSLGQMVDNYTNEFFVQAKYNVNRNTTNNMNLNWVGGQREYQNFSANWFEIDPFNMLFQNNLKSRWENVQRDTDLAVCYRDFGAGNIDDFTYRFDLNISFCNTGAVTSRIGVFTVSEIVDDWNDAKVANWEMSGINMYHVAAGTTYKLRCRYAENGGGALGNNSSNMNVGTMYYIEFSKANTLVKAKIFSDSSFNTLIEAITVILANDNTYRYVLAPQSNGLAAAANDDSSGSINNLWLGGIFGGFALNGNYYTVNLGNYFNGSTIVNLLNCTRNTGSIRVSYSNDNITFRDHNGVIGFDTVSEDGGHSIDMRDLNYTTLYMKIDLIRGDLDKTPEIYQLRIITTQGAISVGGVIQRNLFGVVIVSLIFIPCILVIMKRYKVI